MKRYFMLLAVLFVGMQAASAQTLTQGSLVVLHGEEYVKVVADYSNALIMDLTEEEFAEWEEDWYKDQPQIMSELIEEANDKLDGVLRLSRTRTTNYILRWAVDWIDESGTIMSDFYLETASGEVLAVIENVKGKGGVFGTKLNLIKDGAEETGESLGEFIKRELL